jgi:hypothetical protein
MSDVVPKKVEEETKEAEVPAKQEQLPVVESSSEESPSEEEQGECACVGGWVCFWICMRMYVCI